LFRSENLPSNKKGTKYLQAGEIPFKHIDLKERKTSRIMNCRKSIGMDFIEMNILMEKLM
jgi:ABC-type ATPase involved in cell division